MTRTVALFVVHARRGAAGLGALLGESLTGIFCTDRWRVYERLPGERRQWCWAHLKRDFQARADRGGAGAAVGADLRALTGVLFGWWYKVRDGTRTRRWLQRRIEADLRPDGAAELRRGSECGGAKTAATWRELWKGEPALDTFVLHEGVEATNNRAERALRPAVLWRKRSFGFHSEEGCRFGERLLTVVQTLRLQSRDVLDDLQAAVTAHRSGLPAPKLLNAG